MPHGKTTTESSFYIFGLIIDFLIEDDYLRALVSNYYLDRYLNRGKEIDKKLDCSNYYYYMISLLTNELYFLSKNNVPKIINFKTTLRNGKILFCH